MQPLTARCNPHHTFLYYLILIKLPESISLRRNTISFRWSYSLRNRSHKQSIIISDASDLDNKFSAV